MSGAAVEVKMVEEDLAEKWSFARRLGGDEGGSRAESEEEHSRQRKRQVQRPFGFKFNASSSDPRLSQSPSLSSQVPAVRGRLGAIPRGSCTDLLGLSLGGHVLS